MVSMITYEHLKLDCRFTFIAMLHCSIHSKYGEHTRAEVIGTVKNTEAIEALNNMSEDKLIITRQDNDSAEEILFIGVIECAGYFVP